nr:B12-binding domain-containing radical SAM protein [Clostridiales bacterium]
MNYLIVMPILTEIFEQSYTFPIGMAYVSSSLKQTGRNVFTYNLNYKSGSIEDNLRDVIIKNNIDVIATGGLTAQYWQLVEIFKAARKIKPDIITWIGGGIITSAPIPAMEAFEIADYGIIGEGEITICELADALEGKRDIHSVDGIIFKENGQWTITAQRAEIMDLDSLPYPDYEGFEYDVLLDKKPTDIYALNQGRFGIVSFGRSCPFNCTFCFHPSGTKYRKRSMDSVFKEIDYLIEKYNIRNIAVTDELFVHKIEDVKEFCKRIKERNIGYVISLRVDMVNEEMFQLLKDSNCLSVGFGLESADNSVLKSMKKHITVEQIDEALALCKRIGLNSMGNFIFGDENETYEKAMNTINWWKAHPQYRIALHMIVLYPGSELYRNAVKNGAIKDQVQFIKDGCPYTNISKMTDEEYKDIMLLTCVLNQGRTDIIED